MKEVQTAPPKHRKSVAFSEGATIMDANGEITETSHVEDKVTAEKHSAGKFAVLPYYRKLCALLDLSNVDTKDQRHRTRKSTK